MSTQLKFEQAPFHIKPRADGMFVVYDKNQRQRFKALTRQAANDWIATELARRQPQRQAVHHA